MEEFAFLLVLCGTMFVGSYLAGFLPLAFSFSESKVRLLSILGAGLLVGTALAVILPEGIEALQGAHVQMHHHDSHIAKKILEGDPNAVNDHPPRIVPKDAEMNANVPMDLNAHGESKEQAAPASRSKRDTHPEGNEAGHLGDEHEHNHATAELAPSIGYSLIFGFLLMLIVDQVTKMKQTSRQKVTATVGLVVHSAVDGIALGSASMVNKADIQLIVFVAIMLHKAPASFGLTSILLMEGLEKAKIKKHLFIFACSAPVGAILTFFLMPRPDSAEAAASSASTGIMLLFSAGTFLYVATVHVLPELAAAGRKNDHLALPTSPASPAHSHSGGADFSVSELSLLIIGALLPSLLSAGHHH